MLRRIDHSAEPGSIPLVLIEDEGAGKLLSRLEQAHMLSIQTWPVGLERAAATPNAREVIKKIAHGGRALSDLQADRPAMSGPPSRRGSAR